MGNYVPLHLHTEYSLLDGAIRIKELSNYLKEIGISSCAITDHGWCGGIIEFQKEMKKAGIKPVIGIEAYITEDLPDQPDKSLLTRDNMHAVILCKDEEGLRRLYHLTADAARYNFYYKPRIYRPLLEQLSGHVVITTACLNGILANHLEAERDDDGVVLRVFPTNQEVLDRIIEDYLSWFGEDFYLEIQPWDDNLHTNSTYNKYLIELGKKRGLPLVITSDCHYLRPTDFELHEMLIAMQLKMTLDNYRAGDTMRYGPHFYVRTPEEMLSAAIELGAEEAYHNTNLVASKCNVEIELGKYKPPVFDVKKAPDYEEFLAWAPTHS